ncbi:MAG TPA: DUF421 domain-containing protein [Candidatus Scybalousia intestinigallinarum]|nr:DUF421 domain-containing protein [Candidatus Scybalousia intestinigallinarum]
MDYLIVLERTILFYVIITVLYRFMGKREVGQLGIVDLIVSILIAELAAISIDNRTESIFLSIIPIVVLVLIQMGMAYYSLKNQKVRDAFDGTPSVMINRGKINFKEMVKQRYNIDDLLTQLREQHVKSIEEVDYAILETSGKLSVFKKKDNRFGDYPLPLILDGKIQEDTLTQIQKTKKWLQKTLTEEHVNIEDIFYAFYQEKNIFIIKKEDLEK